jgi:hypothetical protein
MLLLEPEASLEAIPKMLPRSAEERRNGFAVIREVLSASAQISGESAQRLHRVAQLFGVGEGGEGEVHDHPSKKKAS